MQAYSDMKPVVNDPNITFQKLEEEIKRLTDSKALKTAKDQFVVKFRRKKRHMDAQSMRSFEARSGMTPDQFIRHLTALSIKEVADWFIKNPGLGELLDFKGGGGQKFIVVSDHADEVKEVERGYGDAIKPADYIKGFVKFVKENTNQIAAMKLVLQRPSALTRKQLRELQLNLEENGFREQDLKTAYRATTNAEIAAGIIGFIRQAALGDPLKPYDLRVDEAINKMLASRGWSNPQQQWLKRIATQMKKEIVVDKEALNKAQFREVGGFNRINRIFNGELSQILENMTDLIWQMQA
jgi:type I restriction enzyme, R subunit